MPTGIEAFDDRKGDKHTNWSDVIIRMILLVVASLLVSTVEAYNVDGYFKTEVFIHFLPRTAAMSFLYFCGSFQYLVNITQRKVTNADWHKHLNTTTIPDRWNWYRNIGWRNRMIGHGSLIVFGWLYYFL
jgi:hypothetical protein